MMVTHCPSRPPDTHNFMHEAVYAAYASCLNLFAAGVRVRQTSSYNAQVRSKQTTPGVDDYGSLPALLGWNRKGQWGGGRSAETYNDARL